MTELEDACLDLARESVEFAKLVSEARASGKPYDEKEIGERVYRGAWKRYRKAGGDLTMINHQLAPEKDFGGQVARLIREAGIKRESP